MIFNWQEESQSIFTFHLGIKDKIPDQEEFLQRVLKGACSAPANLLEGVSAGMCYILGFVLVFPFVIKETTIQIVSSIPFLTLGSIAVCCWPSSSTL